MSCLVRDGVLRAPKRDIMKYTRPLSCLSGMPREKQARLRLTRLRNETCETPCRTPCETPEPLCHMSTWGAAQWMPVAELRNGSATVRP